MEKLESEEIVVSHQRVSGLPKKRAGRPLGRSGELPESPENFPGSLEVWEVSGEQPVDCSEILVTDLVAPYRTMLRYYRCNTPYRATLFQGGQHSPKMVRYPFLALSFTQAHLCNTPFCYISCDSCAIPHKNKQERVLRYDRYKYRAIWKESLLGL